MVIAIGYSFDNIMPTMNMKIINLSFLKMFYKIFFFFFHLFLNLPKIRNPLNDIHYLHKIRLPL